MKRYLSSLLASVLALGLLAGCGGNGDAAAPTEEPTASPEPVVTAAPAEETASAHGAVLIRVVRGIHRGHPEGEDRL